MRANGWATLVFAVASTAAALPRTPCEYVAVPVDLVLFVVGCSAFLWAYAVAIGRSRYEALTMAGVFFLSDRRRPGARDPQLPACCSASRWWWPWRRRRSAPSRALAFGGARARCSASG